MGFLGWVLAGALLGLLDGPGAAFAGAVLGGMVASMRKERKEILTEYSKRLSALEQEIAILRAQGIGAEANLPLASVPSMQHAPATATLAATAAPSVSEDTAVEARVAEPVSRPVSSIDLDPLYARCRDCVFQTKLDSDSTRIWTVIPRQTGH